MPLKLLCDGEDDRHCLEEAATCRGSGDGGDGGDGGGGDGGGGGGSGEGGARRSRTSEAWFLTFETVPSRSPGRPPVTPAVRKPKCRKFLLGRFYHNVDAQHLKCPRTEGCIQRCSPITHGLGTVQDAAPASDHGKQ